MTPEDFQSRFSGSRGMRLAKAWSQLTVNMTITLRAFDRQGRPFGTPITGKLSAIEEDAVYLDDTLYSRSCIHVPPVVHEENGIGYAVEIVGML